MLPFLFSSPSSMARLCSMRTLVIPQLPHYIFTAFILLFTNCHTLDTLHTQFTGFTPLPRCFCLHICSLYIPQWMGGPGPQSHPGMGPGRLPPPRPIGRGGGLAGGQGRDASRQAGDISVVAESTGGIRINQATAGGTGSQQAGYVLLRCATAVLFVTRHRLPAVTTYVHFSCVAASRILPAPLFFLAFPRPPPITPRRAKHNARHRRALLAPPGSLVRNTRTA